MKFSTLLFLCCACLLTACRQAREFNLVLNLAEPQKKLSLPAEKWFPMDDYEFCAVQGRVNTRIILPDGLILNDVFDIVYLDRRPSGIFRIRADRGRGQLPLARGPERLSRELDYWGEDFLTVGQVKEANEKIGRWLNTEPNRREMYEGFSVPRSGYRIRFSFFSTHPTAEHGLGYSYQIELGDSPSEKSGP